MVRGRPECDTSQQVRNEDSNERIMDEQRTLEVKPSTQSEQFSQVDDSTKNKLLEWLISDVRLLRPMNQRQRDDLKKSFP